MNTPAGLPATSVLVLARLLPCGEKGESRDKLSKDLLSIVGHRWEGSAWTTHLDQAIRELAEIGDLVVTSKGKAVRLSLTSEGHHRGLQALGITQLPPKTTWARIKFPYLVAVALGHPGLSAVDLKRLSGAPGLKAELIRSKFGLDIGPKPTPKQATDALAGKLFGLKSDEVFSPDQIFRSLLEEKGIHLKSTQKPTLKNLQDAIFRRELNESASKNPLDLLIARSVGARQSKPAELAEAVLRQWVDGLPESGKHYTTAERLVPMAVSGEVAKLELSLEEFARKVLTAASKSPEGWFGDAKVFINHVWRNLRFEPGFRSLTFEGFKNQLIEAHRARLLELGRGDLVEAMDSTDVRESATTHLNAVYHFIRAEKEHL